MTTISREALTRESESRNGFVREAALKRLGLVREPWVLPLLFERANDWVMPVRVLARALLHSRIKRYPAFEFAPYLAMVSELRNKKRTDHLGLVRSIEKALLNEPGHVGLRQAIANDDRRVRRLAYGLLFTLAKVDVSLIENALNDSDIVVRLSAAKFVCRRGYGLAELLLTNPSAAVRRLGLGELAKDVNADLRAHLLDENVGVRGDARYFLKKRGVADFVSFYRDALETTHGRERYCALLGLGDLGVAEGLEILAPFLSSDEPRLRRAAARGMGALTCYGARAEEYLLLALADASPSVSREAFRALYFCADVEGLVRLLHETKFEHVRGFAFSLLHKTGKWSSIIELVRLAATPAFVVRAHLEIRRWISRAPRSFVSPSKKEMLDLESVLVGFVGSRDTKADLIRVLAVEKRELNSARS